MIKSNPLAFELGFTINCDNKKAEVLNVLKVKVLAIYHKLYSTKSSKSCMHCDVMNDRRRFLSQENFLFLLNLLQIIKVASCFSRYSFLNLFWNHDINHHSSYRPFNCASYIDNPHGSVATRLLLMYRILTCVRCHQHERRLSTHGYNAQCLKEPNHCSRNKTVAYWFFRCHMSMALRKTAVTLLLTH